MMLIKAESPVVLTLDRSTARLLCTLCGMMVTNTGVGDRLAPIYDQLNNCDIYCDDYEWNLRLSVDKEGQLILANWPGDPNLN